MSMITLSGPIETTEGQGKVAEKMIALAKAHQIPLVEDRNLVHKLDALDINTDIPPELCRAVDLVLVSINRMNSQITEPYTPGNS